MSLGPVILDLAGLELTAEERELLRHPAVGGVILFSRNYRDPDQLAALTTAIHALREPRLLISVDQEGGRVQRFREGFTRLPPAARFGQLARRHPHHARQAAEAVGWLMAAELRVLGVDFSFAPVLDLDRGVSGVIGDRAFADTINAGLRPLPGLVRGGEGRGHGLGRQTLSRSRRGGRGLPRRVAHR